MKIIEIPVAFFLQFYIIIALYKNIVAGKGMAEKKSSKPKERMIKTSIDLTADQYQFLKIKALDRKMRGQDPSFVTILRELIEADRKKSIVFMLIGFLCMAHALPAMASYMPFNTNVNMNIGIGTSTPLGALTVMNGNVGIGTWVPGSVLNVVGNVGIGSVAPAGSLDVSPTGTICFGSSCKTSWASSSNYWSLAGGTGNVGISTTNTVGIGTTAGVGAGLVVMNGNVGIGTWAPVVMFQVSNGSDPFAVDSNGNVGIGTTKTSTAVLSVMGGNVGIGTWVPGSALSVMNGNVGIGSITPAGSLDVSPTGTICFGSSCKTSWASVSNYWSLAGGTGNVGISTTNTVGIGTTSGVGAGLVVMSGNVGIGTWVPANLLDVAGGNIGIGTAFSIMAGGSGNTILTLRTDTTSIYAGYQAGASTTGGSLNNTAYGNQALYSNTTGVQNTANGWAALYWNTTGSWNTASGVQALYNNTTGTGNTAFGYEALKSNTMGLSNAANGYYALQANTTGSYNTANGFQALYANTTGTDNTAVGYNAGSSETYDTYLTLVGENAAPLNNSGDTNEACYGYNCTGNGSNTITFGNHNVTTTIYPYGNVGIGTWVPAGGSYGLVVKGNVGIGTNFVGATGEAALAVMNGNVGIGSVAPAGSLDVSPTGTICFGSSCKTSWVGANNYWSLAGGTGNVGISTTNTVGIGTTSGVGAGLVVMNGNVGIGTWAPAKPFSVTGDAYHNGNIGIGTTFVGGGGGEGALTVMNGNVGIGTWVTNGALDIMNGNVGIGTWVSLTTTLAVNGSIGATGNILENAAGSSTAAPRTFGFAPAFANGQAAQLQFGDNNNVIQNGYGERMQLSAYWGIEIHGAYAGVTGGFIAGTATDPALTVFGSNTATSDILDLDNKAGTVVYDVVTGAGNVGIGTATPVGGLVVTNGNVGIGTWTTSGGSLIVRVGNVGIGSVAPAGSLDVSPTGTICFGSSCKTSWASANNYWSLAGGTGNVGISTTNTVGIGTTSGVGAGLVVMNGNVGIGTWVPAVMFQVSNGFDPFAVDSNGNVGIGTIKTSTAALSVMNGNVGIGTWVPLVPLEIVGVGTTTANGGGLIITNGNVGIGVTSPAQNLDIRTGTFIFSVGNGNGTWLNYSPDGSGDFGVRSTGIMTFQPVMGGTWVGGALTITPTGNTGIGSYQPAGRLDVEGTIPIIFNGLNQAGGNVGIGTTIPVGGLDVESTNPIILNGKVSSVNITGGSLAAPAPATPDTLTLVGGDPSGINPRGIRMYTSDGSGNPYEHFTITASSWYAQAYFTNASVGIGTSASGSTLQVSGNAAIGYSASTAGPSNGLAISGSVGIGTWVPSYELDVKGGAIHVIDTANSITSPTVGTFIGRSDGAGEGMSQWGLVAGDPMMKIANGSWLGGGTSLNFGVNTTSNLDIIENASAGSSLEFGVYNVGGNPIPAMFVNSNGNVGISTTNPGVLLDVGNAGSQAGVIRLAGATSGTLAITVPATVTSWTMTLPAAQNPTAGFQLTVAAANSGVTSWAAPGSLRKWKNIIGLANSSDALDKILHTQVYRFRYKPGMGTGDSKTEYVGVMAEDAPWAMHYDGNIVNPVNTLGYMILGMQSLNNKINSVKTLEAQVEGLRVEIATMKEEIADLKSRIGN